MVDLPAGAVKWNSTMKNELKSFGYRREEVIGGGPLSLVFSAVRESDEKRVAVKVIAKTKLLVNELHSRSSFLQ